MTIQMRHPPTLAEDHVSLRALRSAISARIEADIALLDQLDGDPDSELNGDDEPSLGSIETVVASHHGSQIAWGRSNTDDREDAIDYRNHDEEQDGDDVEVYAPPRRRRPISTAVVVLVDQHGDRYRMSAL